MKRNLETASIATLAMIIVILVFNLTRPQETPRYTITALPPGEFPGTAIKLDSKTGETHRLIIANATTAFWAPVKTISQEEWDKLKAAVDKQTNSKKD